MSDGLPTPEQLARIQRGVMGRIDRRRAIGRRITGTAVAVAVVGGGFGLIGPFLSIAGTSGASSGSAAGSAASGAADGVAVLCHATAGRDSSTTEVSVDPAALPGAAAAACLRVDFQSGTGRMPSTAEADPADVPTTMSGGTAVPDSGVAVCRAPGGLLHVYPLAVLHDDAAAALCARNGMTEVRD